MRTCFSPHSSMSSSLWTKQLSRPSCWFQQPILQSCWFQQPLSILQPGHFVDIILVRYFRYGIVPRASKTTTSSSQPATAVISSNTITSGNQFDTLETTLSYASGHPAYGNKVGMLQIDIERGQTVNEEEEILLSSPTVRERKFVKVGKGAGRRNRKGLDGTLSVVEGLPMLDHVLDAVHINATQEVGFFWGTGLWTPCISMPRRRWALEWGQGFGVEVGVGGGGQGF